MIWGFPGLDLGANHVQDGDGGQLVTSSVSAGHSRAVRGKVNAMAELAERTAQPAPRTLFGHPIGLANLFGVELW